MDRLCYLSLVFVMLPRLFIAALWSPAGKGLTSWFLFVMFNCVFITFPCDILGQVWYLIVSVPDLYQLSYFISPTKSTINIKQNVFACKRRWSISKEITIFFPKECLPRHIYVIYHNNVFTKKRYSK